MLIRGDGNFIILMQPCRSGAATFSFNRMRENIQSLYIRISALVQVRARAQFFFTGDKGNEIDFEDVRVRTKYPYGRTSTSQALQSEGKQNCTKNLFLYAQNNLARLTRKELNA